MANTDRYRVFDCWLSAPGEIEPLDFRAVREQCADRPVRLELHVLGGLDLPPGEFRCEVRWYRRGGRQVFVDLFGKHDGLPPTIMLLPDGRNFTGGILASAVGGCP